MKCPHCGQEHPDNTKFCPETGKKLDLQFWVCDKPNCNFRQPLPPTANYCPNCGGSRNEQGEKQRQQTHSDTERMSGSDAHENDLVFPLYDIVLGKTTIKDLFEQGKYLKVGEYSSCNGGRVMEITPSISVVAAYDDAPIDMICSEDYNEDIEIWSQFIPLQKEMSLNKIVKYCKKHNVDYLSDRNEVVILIKDGQYVLSINDSDRICLVNTYPCPNCGGLNFKLKRFDRYGSLELICDSCNQTYDLSEAIERNRNSCPSCGSTDYVDDESDYLQFKCNDCGRVWGCELEEEEEPDTDYEDDDDKDDEDELICPECGSDDCEDDGTGYLQFKCNDCGHIWGDESDDSDEDNDDEEDDFSLFFPILDITLGETTDEDIKYKDFLYSEIEYCDDGTVIAWSRNSDGSKGAQIRKESDEYEFSNVYITHSDDMFEEWGNMGFDWNLSYKEWIQLFEDREYDIQIITSPHREYYEKRGYWYLDAKFRAISPDYSLFFELDFSFGKNGTNEKSKGTLYSISVANNIERL